MPTADPKRLTKRQYEKELARLQVEIVRLQDWVIHNGLKVVVVFEGRDTAGKGGTIKRITEKTNPRIVRTVALGTPTECERTQWYFQRYVAHSAGRRGDGAVRPQLVQPRRRRARDGLLHAGRIRGVHAPLISRCRSGNPANAASASRRRARVLTGSR